MTDRVVVIGAGVHGAAAALPLARAGAEVVVVERLGGPAEGPTGRSSAICRAYYTNPFLAEVARDAMERLEDFGAWLGADATSGYRRLGALYLHGEDEVDDVEITRARLADIGTTTAALTPDGVRGMAPSLALDGVGIGVWEPDAGQADPVVTTASMLAAARRHGAEVRFRTGVAAVEPGPSPAVVLDDGSRLPADRVLVAAGPWTRPLLADAGVELPLIVERHLVTLHGWGPVPRLPFVMADLTTSVYLTQEGPDQFGLGPLDAGPEVDVDTNRTEVLQTELVELVERAGVRIPGIEETEVRGGWASVYDVSPDWQPVIGEVADGVVVHAGSSGHGFKLAPALGDHVAGVVLDRVHDDRVAMFHPRRFATGDRLAAGFGENPIIG